MWAHVHIHNLKTFKHGVTDCVVVPEAVKRQPPVPPLPLAAFVRDPGETGCQKQACPGAEPTTAQQLIYQLFGSVTSHIDISLSFYIKHITDRIST